MRLGACTPCRGLVCSRHGGYRSTRSLPHRPDPIQVRANPTGTGPLFFVVCKLQRGDFRGGFQAACKLQAVIADRRYTDQDGTSIRVLSAGPQDEFDKGCEMTQKTGGFPRNRRPWIDHRTGIRRADLPETTGPSVPGGFGPSARIAASALKMTGTPWKSSPRRVAQRC